jgi:hypothetical protein
VLKASSVQPLFSRTNTAAIERPTLVIAALTLKPHINQSYTPSPHASIVPRIHTSAPQRTSRGRNDHQTEDLMPSIDVQIHLRISIVEKLNDRRIALDGRRRFHPAVPANLAVRMRSLLRCSSSTSLRAMPTGILVTRTVLRRLGSVDWKEWVTL